MAGRKFNPSRNRYAQNCCVCGERVEALAGFLTSKKKSDKSTGKYSVHHEGCPVKGLASKSGKNEIIVDVTVDIDEDKILSILEATLVNRQMQGQPVVMLPKIIDYIKSLQLKIVELSK
jgi:hypothetical protein